MYRVGSTGYEPIASAIHQHGQFKHLRTAPGQAQCSVLEAHLQSRSTGQGSLGRVRSGPFLYFWRYFLDFLDEWTEGVRE
jgi:hypothetical protein